MKTIIVSGALANRPLNGGGSWVRLSWLRGLQRLGFQVFFIEQIAPQTCVDDTGKPAAFEESETCRYFVEVLGQFSLAGSAALVCGEGEEVCGADYGDLLEVARSAVLLVNISGHLTLKPLFEPISRKVYLDIDPGFTQFWHAAGNMGARLAGHDEYYTIGENIGLADCWIPTGNIRWRHTRQPVVLADWPVCDVGQIANPSHDSADAGPKGTVPFSSNEHWDSPPARFTTVANWRGPYGPIEHGGRLLGLKVHEFRKFLRLPHLAEGTFELALSIHPGDEKDRRLLQEHGWRLVDPVAAARGPLGFRGYVQGSGAEFSAAQGVYVDTNSGWFSDRSVRYLASGKPVLVQDTGLGRHYPLGEGLVVFGTLEEAVAGAGRIAAEYEHHSLAARRVAEEYFDSDKVLGQMLDELHVSP